MKSLKVERFYSSNEGFIVAHTYIPSDDPRRYTDFYICGNEKSAINLNEILSSKIENPDTKAGALGD